MAIRGLRGLLQRVNKGLAAGRNICRPGRSNPGFLTLLWTFGYRHVEGSLEPHGLSLPHAHKFTPTLSPSQLMMCTLECARWQSEDVLIKQLEANPAMQAAEVSTTSLQ